MSHKTKSNGRFCRVSRRSVSRFWNFETSGKSLLCCRTILEQYGGQNIYTSANFSKKTVSCQRKSAKPMFQ
jgi:hypothetical protein